MRRKRDFSKYEDRQNFYREKEWLNLRALKLSINPMCQRCSKEERPVPADQVHHIVDIRDDPERRLDISNLESLCAKCHAKETYSIYLRGSWEKTKDIKLAKRKWEINLPGDFPNLPRCTKKK